MSIFETLKKYGKSKNNAIAEAIKDFNEFKTSGYIQSKRPSSGNIEVAIQALQAQAERRWIPVSERLPEDGRTILTYTIGGNIEVFLYDSSTYQPVWYGVTHWMPLPEPPKEDNNG